MESLTEIRSTLNAALANEALFSLVNTRLVLSTGIDLSKFPEKDNQNPQAVSKVLAALASMGYSKSSLQVLARRKKS